MIVSSREIPREIVRTFFIASGWKGAHTFSRVNQYANALFKSEELQRRLIFSHFGCALSKTVTPNNQYFRLSRARAGFSNPDTACISSFSVYGIGTELFCVSADGTKALCHAYREETAVLKDLTSGVCVPALRGYKKLDWYQGYMDCTEIKSDGTRALLQAYGTLAFWDLTKDICSHTFVHEGGLLTCFQVNADWTIAMSADWSGKLKRWDLEAGICTGTFDFSPKGQIITCMHMSADGTSVILGFKNGTLIHQNLTNGECITLIHIEDFAENELIASGHENEYLIDCVQMSADGSRALSTTGRLLKSWDLTNGTCIDIFCADDVITSLQMSADGTTALSGSKLGFLTFWDLTKKESFTLQFPCIDTYNNFVATPIKRVTMSADGLTAFSLSSDRILKCWNLAPSNTRRLEALWRKYGSSTSQVHSL